MGLILAGVGAAVFLVVVVFAFASGGRRARPVRRQVPIVHRPSTIIVDWYSRGFSRGVHWRSVMRNRQKPYTPEEVRETADRMTSDYANKGITKEGEEQFIKGFCRAVLGE